MLKSLSLQSFRSYKKSDFDFDGKTTLIVGVNTSGKTNLIEAIFLLSRGKSFRTDKDPQMIQYEKDLARLRGKTDEESLEVVLTTGDIQGKRTPFKKFMVNGVSKRRLDFTGFLPTVLFSPEDLELIIGSPSLRRRFLNDVLEQSDRDYRLALISFEKGIRQRNALLDRAKDTGRRNEEQFEYWDRIVIDNGAVLTQKRQEYIEYLNKEPKEILDFEIEYDKSVISEERLYQYRDAELGAGVTLVGPHRDDFSIFIKEKDLKAFGSQGEQRTAILALKLSELLVLEKEKGVKPIFLLDDISSELDNQRKSFLFQALREKNTQVFVTTTDVKSIYMDKKESSVFKVEKGKACLLK